MTKYVALDLGLAGVADMKKWFQGWDRLASYAGNYLETFQHCLAFVPEGTSLTEAKAYDTGRYWRSGGLATAKYLMAVHAQHPDYCLITMDHCISPSDPHVPDYNRVFFYQNQVYDYLNGVDFSEEAVRDTLNRGMPSMSFLIKGSIDETLYEKRFVPAAVFENLAANIKMILRSAYDDESYLLAY